jgi:hypothetical protein
MRGVRQEGFRTGVREASTWDVHGLRQSRVWTVWRSRHPANRKHLLAALAHEIPDMWEHRPIYVILPPPVGKRKKIMDNGHTPGSTVPKQ